MLSRSPVETRIGEDMGERDSERIARKDRTAFSVFFKTRSCEWERGGLLAGSWPDEQASEDRGALRVSRLERQ